MQVIRTYTIWLMGLTSSGKSTIAEHLVNILQNNDIPILHYDGDEVRSFFGKDFGFTEDNRGRVVETLAHLAIKANNAGINVVVSALTAHQTAREHIKKTIPNLLVGHVDCPIDICVARDPKGLYEKAGNGEIDTLIGYNSTYQPPVEPDIKLDTSMFSAEENAHRLYGFLENHIKSRH
jgi:adenylylsulfate kinase